MDLNVVLPFLSSALSFVFAALVGDQWIRRRQPYQLVWTIGLLWYGISAGTEFLGGASGWNEVLYRTWYLTGAVWVAAWLGLGSVYLLARTRFGFAFAGALLLAGLFTYLTQRRYEYPEAGVAPILYGLIAVVGAIAVSYLSWRRSPAWAHAAAMLIVGGTIASAVMMLAIQLPAPGFAVDPGSGTPTGELFPGYLRLLTPFMNISGAFALVLGAIFSAYVFMPKKRLMTYKLGADQGVATRLGSLLLAPIAIAVNFIASLPGSIAALASGRLNSRVPATLLIALGGIVVSVTSGLGRFGDTSAHAIGLLIGVLLIFIGFLVSIEVFSDVRLPFTRVVLVRRERAERASR